jgi:hypothetical protein
MEKKGRRVELWVTTFRRNTLSSSSGLNIEVVCSSEMLVPTYKSTRRQNPEDQHQQLHRRKDHRSHTASIACLYSHPQIYDCFTYKYLRNVDLTGWFPFAGIITTSGRMIGERLSASGTRLNTSSPVQSTYHGNKSSTESVPRSSTGGLKSVSRQSLLDIVSCRLGVGRNKQQQQNQVLFSNCCACHSTCREKRDLSILLWHRNVHYIAARRTTNIYFPK